VNLTVRGQKAYFTVPCGEGGVHSVILNLNGTFYSRNGEHNFEEEQVIEMLGGEPSNCAKVQRIYETALISFKARYGFEDPKDVYTISSDEYWKSDIVCSSCANYRGSGSVSKTILHFSSVDHVAEVKGVGAYKSLAKRLIKWFERNNLMGVDAESDLKYVGALSYINESLFSVRTTKHGLTPRFVTIAEKFVGQNAANIIKLRNVATIERLTSILNEVGESKIRLIGNKIRRNSNGRKDFATMLIANRIVPTHIIIDFLKAGIHANIYTYSKHYATAHQALRVYNASGGEKTLKDYISEGVAPRDAVRIAEELASNNPQESL
jgi:hypothetical protein